MQLPLVHVTFFREGAADGSAPLAELPMLAVPGVGEAVSFAGPGGLLFSGTVSARSWVIMAEGKGTAVVV